MRFLAVTRRELSAYFASPVAGVVMTIFLVVTGYFFYSVIGYYSLVSSESLAGAGTSPDLNLLEGVTRPFFSNVAIILLFFIPMLSMRLFAEELRMGTFELLFSYPVRDAEAVLGKFLASLCFLALLLGGTLVGSVLSTTVAHPEPGPILTAYLGLLLLGSAFLSVGLFTSALTRNQIVAGFASFGVLLLFVLIEWSARFVGPRTAGVLTQLSIMEHFGDFAKGVIDTKDVAYYVLFTLFFLYATTRAIELRRVRGL